MKTTLAEIDAQEAWLEFRDIWLLMHGFEPLKTDSLVRDYFEWFCKGKASK